MSTEDQPNGVWAAIFRNLSQHPEGTICTGILFSASLLWVSGAPIWVSCVVPISTYIAYLLRMTLREKHLERMADKEIERLERVEGEKLEAKAQRTLQRRRSKG